MKFQKLKELFKVHLAINYDKSGGFLYSNISTLSRGKFYFLGFNPGGGSGITLGERLKKDFEKTSNDFTDESWKGKAAGQSTLQLRVGHLFNELGTTVNDVCSSNLIFFQSKDASGVNYELDAKQCWPIHEEIIKNIVQPDCVITHGNGKKSAFNFIKRQMGIKDNDIKIENSGHGNWKCRSFTHKYNGRDIIVIGIPHLSRYSIFGKTNVIKWIKEHL